MKRIIIAVFFLFTQGLAFGQGDLIAQKKIFRLADSLNALGKINRFDTAVFKIADSLNSCHPTGYFQVAGELINISKFNEAAFIYYLGNLRYRYYNSVFPKFEPSGDGALFSALKRMMGEPINMYERVNADNFISVLKRVTKYAAENDYKYCSHYRNIEKYNEITDQYNVMIADLETNKEKYSAQWKKERIEYENKIDAIIEETKRKEEAGTQEK